MTSSSLHEPVVRREAEPDVVSIKKIDDELQVVYGEVYAPNVPDSQGDYMIAVEIRKAAHKFVADGLVTKIDTNHDRRENGSSVVESFIARDDDNMFIPGSWVVGVHIPNRDTWRLVKTGALNGFSFDGMAVRSAKDFEVSIPDNLTGQTDKFEGHEHSFAVKFSVTGEFLGGETDEVAGHKHLIKAGTVTEDVHGHRHRFNVVDGWIHAQSAH